VTLADRQLRNELRTVQARLAALEAALAARPARRKRAAAPRPDDSVVAGREQLWAQYLRLEMTHGHGRTKLSKLAFATKWHLNPDEFVRWFSATDKRGVPEGSKPDRSHRRALAAAIAELEGRGKNDSVNTRVVSRDKLAFSQFSNSRPQ
jgi:hypothetical protein